MSLRRKLVYLLAAFAVFALTAAFATVFGIQHRVDSAILRFQRSLGQTQEVDELRMEAREQRVRLHDLIAGARPLDSIEQDTFKAFLNRLEAAVQFAPPREESPAWADVLAVSGKIRSAFDGCVALGNATRDSEAYRCLEQQLRNGLLLELDAQLLTVKRLLDEARNRSVISLSWTGREVVVLGIVIGACGMGLVAIGAALIRRWLIQPIDTLHAATQEFGCGNLDHRVAIGSGDELGRLGEAMNRMANEVGQEFQLSRGKSSFDFPPAHAPGEQVQFHAGVG